MVGSLRLSIYLHGQTFEKYFFSKSCHPARIRSHDPQRQVETLPLDLAYRVLKKFYFYFCDVPGVFAITNFGEKFFFFKKTIL
jgi:hypothetical protein